MSEQYLTDNKPSLNYETLPSYEEATRQEQSTPLHNASTAISSSSSIPQIPSRRYTAQTSAYSSDSSTSSQHPHRPPINRLNNPNNIPWVYPQGYYCSKCNNTGYKLKNGKSCRSCWRQFAPSNHISTFPAQQNYYPSYGYNSLTSFMNNFVPPQPIQMQPYTQQRPLYVKPGDPRIGGILCGECRGSGRIRLFLDERLCPLCNGVGRIVR